MLKIKWTDRITIYGVFQREKEEKLLLKIKKNNRRHSWILHTISHNELVVNILEGAIFGTNVLGKTSTILLKIICQKHRCRLKAAKQTK